jgi:cytochrome c oxidase cbb3-type subunit IV
MDLDINIFRSLATVLAFLAFMAIFWWTYSSKRKQSFDEAANIPFREVLKGDPETTHAKQQRGNTHD